MRVLSWSDATLNQIALELHHAGLRGVEGAQLAGTQQRQQENESEEMRNALERNGLAVVDDPYMGKRLLSTRPLMPGDIVFEDTPVLAVPEDPSRLGRWCAHCSRPLFDIGSEVNACPVQACPRRFCGSFCASRGRLVHKAECSLVTVVKKSWTSLSSKSAAVIARAIALYVAGKNGDDEAQAAYTRLIELEANEHHARTSDPAYKLWLSGATSLAKDLQMNGIAIEVGALIRVHLIHRINGVRIAPRGDGRDSHGGLIAIFPLFSRLEHSCDPTCVYADEVNAFASSPSRCAAASLVVRTVRSLSAGDPLSISYGRLEVALARRRAYCAEKYFCCKCVRCTNEAALAKKCSCGNALPAVSPDGQIALHCPRCGVADDITLLDMQAFETYEKLCACDDNIGSKRRTTPAQDVWNLLDSLATKLPKNHYVVALLNGRLVDCLLESLPPLTAYLGLDEKSRRVCLGPFLRSSPAACNAPEVAKRARSACEMTLRIAEQEWPAACAVRLAELHFRAVQAALLLNDKPGATLSMSKTKAAVTLAYGARRAECLQLAL